RVIKKENLLPSQINEFSDRFGGTALRFEQIPFVQNNHGWFVRLLDQTRDMFILRSHALRQIDEQNAEIGPTEAALGPHHAEDLHGGRTLSAPPNSCGIDKEEPSAVAFERDVDGVARGSRQLADNGAFAVHDKIDKRRFSGVWPPQDGHCCGTLSLERRRFPAGRRGEELLDFAQQIQNPAAVLGADRNASLKTQRVKFCRQRFVLGRVDLVNHQNYWFPCLAQNARHVSVNRR